MSAERADPAASPGIGGIAQSMFHRFTKTSPPRTALLIFALVILVFTALLMMPFATSSGEPASPIDAFFVATSAVTVTGLTPVNTGEYWSTGGHLVIFAGIQIGGLGILTLASLVALSVTRHLGLRTRLVAQEGISTGRLGEVGSLIRTVVVCSVVVQTGLALILVPRLVMLEEDLLSGIWHGVFYSASAFNNAGFLLHADGLMGVDYDPIIIWTLMLGVFLGSLGFPVLLLLWRHRWRIAQWSLHARLTMEFTLAFAILGAIGYGLIEWNHMSTLGGMTFWEKIQNSLFASVMMRSGGFSVVENALERSETSLMTNALMFVGGGSASTAGGIKVTTFAVILLAFIAEARGHRECTAHGRTIPPQMLRIAISVVAMGATFVLFSTFLLMSFSDEGLERTLFESISAFGTSGLTSGLTAELPPAGLFTLSLLMFVGRVGTMTFAAALTMRHRTVRYQYPEGRPIIG